MDEGEQNKSELATPFKLQRARQKGTVARSMDLGFLTAFAAMLGYFWSSGAASIDHIVQTARITLAAASGISAEPSALFALSAGMFDAAARPIAMMAGVIFLVVLLFELIQTGVVFSAQPLKPDFSRINPAKGFKRLFSWQMLINAAKNIAKFAAYSAVGFLAIREAFRHYGGTIADGGTLATAMTDAGLRLMIYFILVAAAFAVLDQFLVRRAFGRQMRMSRREVRRESRDREGEPRMKQRRKKLHAEFVANSTSLRNMRSADLLIVNPSHYAVALRYEPGSMAAPRVVAQGAHQFALRLKRLAFIYGVTIVQDPPLARQLHKMCTLEREIPEIFYRQIADIYLSLRARRALRWGGGS